MKLSDVGITRNKEERVHVGLRLSRHDVERALKLMDDPAHGFTYFGQVARYLVQKGLDAEGL